MALKHHAKPEVAQLISCLEEAGIRGVLFTREDILKAQAIAQDLGVETGWNCWISLDDDPDIHVLGGLGQQVIPFGIKKIEEHLNRHIKQDDIPLRVRIYCKTDCQRTE